LRITDNDLIPPISYTRRLFNAQLSAAQLRPSSVIMQQWSYKTLYSNDRASLNSKYLLWSYKTVCRFTFQLDTLYLLLWKTYFVHFKSSSYRTWK